MRGGILDMEMGTKRMQLNTISGKRNVATIMYLEIHICGVSFHAVTYIYVTVTATLAYNLFCSSF
jgi:hypothetical protein